MEDENILENAHCVINGSRGIYCPQSFVRKFKEELENIGNVLVDEAIPVLELGPDQDFYWDCWEDIIDNAVIPFNGVLC